MERLIELRKKHKLTQSDMSAILGISRQAYSNYELGNREADYSTLSKLADYFGVSVDYLLGRDTPESSSDDNVKVALFGGDGEVTDEMWEEVKNFTEYIKEKYKKK
ncbi:MAG: helix-turn-helix transcriptional regulator [Clostridiales bacterium]|nr:helix-turn-helix transcriptional regulator [Clostridiales bacterium]